MHRQRKIPKGCFHQICVMRQHPVVISTIKRAAGIEPASSAWKAEVLPLHNARTSTDKLPLLKGGACVSTPPL